MSFPLLLSAPPARATAQASVAQARFAQPRPLRAGPAWWLCLLALAGVGAGAAPGAAVAQIPLHLRGEVISMSITPEVRAPLRLRLRDGSEVAIELAFNFQGVALQAAGVDRLVPGTLVSVAAGPAADGSLHALAVLLPSHIKYALGESRAAWDLAPRSTMVTATIAGVTVGHAARTLTLHASDGDSTLSVADDVPMAEIESVSRNSLAPGTRVFVTATRQRDGTLVAARLYYGLHGYAPAL